MGHRTKRNPTSRNLLGLQRLLPLLLLTLIICAVSATALLIFYLPEQVHADITQPSPVLCKSTSSPPVVNIRPGWWETKDAIYHDIPARILFHLNAENAERACDISQKAWAEFKRIGLICNPFNPVSELARLNAEDKSKKIRVSEELFDLIHISRCIWLASNGYFDPTTWPIKRMWLKAEQTGRLPTEREILKHLQHTGLGKVHLSGEKTRAVWADDPDIMFDFGGIAKGYAVDRVRELLMRNGIRAGLVQLGGEVSAFGSNDKTPWRIGIQHPRLINRIWGLLTADSRISVSTSGNYRQPMIIEGETLYHIFNPKTGKPVSERVLGVTTAGFDGEKSNALLDGAATAITVAGPNDGIHIAEKLGIQMLILYEKKDGSVGELMSPGFARHYTPEDTPQ